MLLSVEVVVEARNELGEGVLWSPADNEVQWTDIFGRRFWAYRPSDGASRSVALPDRLGVLRAARQEEAARRLCRRARNL